MRGEVEKWDGMMRNEKMRRVESKNVLKGNGELRMRGREMSQNNFDFSFNKNEKEKTESTETTIFSKKRGEREKFLLVKNVHNVHPGSCCERERQ